MGERERRDGGEARTEQNLADGLDDRDAHGAVHLRVGPVVRDLGGGRGRKVLDVEILDAPEAEHKEGEQRRQHYDVWRQG